MTEEKQLDIKELEEELKNWSSVEDIAAQRIEVIKNKIWLIRLDDFREEGILSQLEWEKIGYHSHYECSHLVSKETQENIPIEKQVRSWYWRKRKSPGSEWITFYSKDDVKIGMSLFSREGMEESDNQEDLWAISIFAIYVGNDYIQHKPRVEKEKAAFRAFAEEWNIIIEKEE